MCVALRSSAGWGRDGLARVGRFKEESLAGEEKRARVFLPDASNRDPTGGFRAFILAATLREPLRADGQLGEVCT